MGIYTEPNLKGEAVVCQTPCKHEKCAAIRREWADAKCRKCGKPFQAGDLLVYSEEAAKSWKDRHECIGCAFEGGQNEGYQTAGQCRS
jgi:hypothetical protein